MNAATLQPHEIIDSVKDHQWWTIVAEQDIHTVTKHHNTVYLLIAKGTKEKSDSHRFNQVIDFSTDSMRFLHYVPSDVMHIKLTELFMNQSCQECLTWI